jgi:hypothetical protein
MRRPLRHALAVIQAAGFRVTDVHQAGRHTEIYVEGGNCIRLHRGGHMSKSFERGLRSTIRKWGFND